MLSIIAMLGCKRESAKDQPKPGTTSAVIDSLLAGVPGDAFAIGFVDAPAPPWTMLTGGLVPLDEPTRKTLDKDLREYVERYVGVDVSKVQYAVAYVAGPPPRGAVLVKSIGGSLKLPGAADHAGGKIWVVDRDEGVSLAMKGDIVVLGADAAVRDVLDTLAGTRKAVTAENKPLVDWLRSETKGAGLGFAAIAPKDLPLPPPIAGLQRVAVSIGRTGVRAVIDGEPAAISTVQKLVDEAFAKALSEAERARAEAIAGNIPPPEGAFAILGAAYAKSYAAKLKPRRDGTRLSVSLDLALDDTQPVVMLSMLGILSAVAVPAFMDYMKKSKKTEASLQLNRLGKNLKVVYATTAELPKGETPLTPAESCCYGPGAKCPVQSHSWREPIWQALDFEIDEPHLFQYRYRSDGQSAVVEAHGDLDCDGNTIVYRLDLTTAGGNPMMTIAEPSPNSD